MRYAVPAFLAQAGRLERFYTDAHAGDYPRILSRLPGPLMPKVVRRILGRVLPAAIPTNRVRSIPLRTICCHLLGGGIERHMARTVLRGGFGEADAIYTVTTADYAAIVAAKSRGLYVVHEQFECPEDRAIVRAEREAYPGIEPPPSGRADELYLEHHRRQWNAADRILAPSPFVRDAAVRLGADPSKIELVPYGVSDRWLAVPARTIPGRVLFVGTAGLRKGVHYLASAARALKKRGVPAEVRVVGRAPERLRKSDLFEGPVYTGHVPHGDIESEYACADVFAFPTLSDSFGLVQLEAMACGVPVIATPNCGAVVRDGIDGFVAPVRDAEALADRIETVVTNRALRAELSANARKRAREFVWDIYRQKLLAALG
jgi:glycosyltransferase involved in cell wall biosynthesis